MGRWLNSTKKLSAEKISKGLYVAGSQPRTTNSNCLGTAVFESAKPMIPKFAGEKLADGTVVCELSRTNWLASKRR